MLIVFGGAFVLLCGRATWGGIVDWLPFGEALHFHRFLAPLHWAGVALGCYALAALTNSIAWLLTDIDDASQESGESSATDAGRPGS